MNKPNAYLREREARDQKFLDIGEQIGMQKMWDYIQVVLHNPKVMAKDTFGAARLKKIYEELSRTAARYSIAFTNEKEADYYQEGQGFLLAEMAKLGFEVTPDGRVLYVENSETGEVMPAKLVRGVTQ